MTSHSETIKTTILASLDYRRGNDITLSTVRNMFDDGLVGIDRATIAKAINDLADTGFLVKTKTGTHTPCSRAGHWLRHRWGRGRDNRTLFGQEYDQIMAVAS